MKINDVNANSDPFINLSNLHHSNVSLGISINKFYGSQKTNYFLFLKDNLDLYEINLNVVELSNSNLIKTTNSSVNFKNL